MFLILSNIHRFFYSFFFFETIEIVAGNVGAVNNSNLCYFNTIIWNEIINTDSDEWKFYSCNGFKEKGCPSCDESCTIKSCWGVGLHNCQKFSKINCSHKCNQRRCFKPRSGGCCHLLCAGGCTGPKKTDCLVNITVLYIIFFISILLYPLLLLFYIVMFTFL